MLSWAKGSREARAGGDHTSNHICRAHKAVQSSCSALTAGDREKRQQNHPSSSRKVKGSRRAKVAGFAFPRPKVTCVTYALLSPTLLSAIKLIRHDVSRSVLTFFNHFYPFFAQASQSTGMITPPCTSLQRFDP